VNEHKVICAREVMTAGYLEMDGLSTVADALREILDSGKSLVIVSKRHAHDAHGIVVLADVAKKVLARDQAPERVNLYEIMTKPLISLPPHLDVRYCARLFERFGLSVAPVMEDDRVIGIVSYSDLVLKGLCREADRAPG